MDHQVLFRAGSPERLAALRRTALLDTPAEEGFDRLTRLACRVLGVPVALVSLVDEDRQFFKSQCGLPEPWASRRETPLSHSFCQHAVNSGEPLIIEDAREHPLVRDNLAIGDLDVIAYAGIPLITADGHALGSFCVIDGKPRRWTEEEVQTLTDLAAVAMVEVERSDAAYLRIEEAQRELREHEVQLEEAMQVARLGRWVWDVGSDHVSWSDELYRIYGLEPQSVPITLEGFLGRLHPKDRDHTREQVERAMRTGEPFAFEERIIRPDGEVRTLQSRGEVTRDDDGEPVRLIGTCLDITDQKQAEERAVQLAQEQTAREQAEREEQRSRFLASASSLLSSSLDYRTTLNNLAHLVVPDIADWCAIDVVGEDGVAHRVVTAHPDPDKERLAQELEQRYPPDPNAVTGVPQVLRTGEPELVPEIPEELLDAAAHDEEHRRIIQELQLRSYMIVPLIARGRTLGAITFVAAESGRLYDATDLTLAQDLAHRAALAVDNARLFRAAERAGQQTTRILESITDAFFALDREWRFSYLNDEAENLLQRTRDELLGRGIWDKFPEAVGSTFEREYVRAATENRTVQFTEYFPPLESWFEVRAYPSPDGLSVYFRNINDRVEAEEALRYQSMLTRTITDNATSALFMMNEKGQCTFMNPAAEAMIGFTLDEIRDMPLHDAIHHHHPDGRPYPIHECPIDRALPEDFSVRAHEDVFFRKNGEQFPVSCAAAPIFEEGRPIGTVVEVRDTTEEKKAAQALQQSEQRFRSLIEATAAIVWTTPASGEFGGPQPGWQAFTGQAPEQYEQWGWLEMIHPDDRNKSVHAWQSALENRAVYEVEHRVRRHDGELRHMLARAVPVLEPDGQIREWIGIHTDITPRKRMEERQRILAEAGRLLTASLDLGEILENLTRSVVPQVADWCAVYVVDDAGAIRPIQIAHVDADKVGFGWQLLEQYPVDPEAPTGSARVVRTGESEIVAEVPEELLERIARDEEHLRLLRSLGLRTYMSVPLQAHGRVLGVLSLYSSEPGRRFDADDLQLAEELGRRAALALDNARLFAEREQVLTELRASEQSYRFLAESIPQLVWTTTPEGYHDYFNERWYQYTGMPQPGEPGGEGVGPDTMPQGWNWKNFLHPDDHDRALDVWGHSLRTGDPYQIEYRIRRAADGAYRWFLARALPLRDEHGGILRWFGTCTEIHDQKEAEAERDRLIAELDLERTRLSNIFMEAPAFIATLRGPEHVFEMANPVYYQLIGEREIVGKPVREALPEIEGQGFFELLDGVYRSGEPFVGNEARVVVQRRPDPSPNEAFVNFVYQPILGPAGEVTGIFVHGVDVTLQVRARQEVERTADELRRIAGALERSNQELDQFAYVTSHDLKAPLRGIANLAQWIEEDLPGEMPDEVQEHLNLLKGRVHRMEGLIDGILQYSRAGRVRGETELVDTGMLVHEVVELLDPPENLTLEIAPGFPTLRTERLQLQQVFMNLIGNAVKYIGRPDGTIRVEWRESSGVHEFSVSDDGPGIAPEYHERIFGIFQTLEARDKVEGTGIGLSLIKKIVENRGGRVWVESAEGAGATFRFTWPA